MSWSEKIFKAYDVRGVYPDDFNKEIAYQIGRVFADYTKAKKILIGRDVRLSGQDIFNGLAEGLAEQGVDVFDVGLVPIDFVYSMAAKNGYDAGIMITASHNPKEYNGLKMFTYSGKPWIEWVDGKTIKELIDKKIESLENKGKIEKVDYWQKYIEHIFSFIDKNKIKPFRILIDAGNGAAAKAIPLIEKCLPCKIVRRFFETDGTFPSRSLNPVEIEVTRNVGKEVIKENADFGVVFDGDTDRIVLIDEKGEPLLGDSQILLLAKEVLSKNPGATIVYNIGLSRSVPEFINKMGGKSFKTRVGFCYNIKALIENNGIMSGELSCHYAFRDNFYADSGFIALLMFLEIISQENKPLSEIVKEYRIYHKVHEPSIKVADKENTFKLLKEKYYDGEIDEMDGVTIEYDDWWFNLRPSNTEPVVRLTVEAKTEELLKEKLAEVKNLIN
ncbi:MAG: phosphomannomutase/phosphoglucomutase [Patescibacteria group bacterium]